MFDLDLLRQLTPGIYNQIIDGELEKKDIIDIFEQLIILAEEYERLVGADYEISNYEDRFKPQKASNVVSLALWRDSHPKKDPEPPKAG